MHYLKIFSFLLVASLFLTSCFELKEEISMNADGSGSMTLTINLSQSKQNLANFLKGGEFQGQKLPSKEEIIEKINEAKNILANVEGLSDIQNTTDFENFIFTFSGDFANVEALNNAVNILSEKMNETPYPVEKVRNFSYGGNTFNRLFEYPVDPLDPAEYEKLGSMERFVMESAKIVSIYRFENEVKSVNNQRAKVSPSKKAIKLEHSIADLVKGASTIETAVSF